MVSNIHHDRFQPRPSTVAANDNMSPGLLMLENRALNLNRMSLATARMRRLIDQMDDGQQPCVKLWNAMFGARSELRDAMVCLRKQGHWRADKCGLRSVVRLIWEADQHIHQIMPADMKLNG